MRKEIRIGVDVDGGDNTSGGLASMRIADGVRRFAEERLDVSLNLYGTRESFRGFDGNSPVNSSLYYADVHPDKSELRFVKGSSLNMLACAAKDGKIGGFFSNGDTARVAIESVRMRRLDGVRMPTLVANAPWVNGEFFVSDAGATGLSSRAEFYKKAIGQQASDIYKQGIMASTYVGRVIGRLPVVGIPSNGEEKIKGSDLCKAVDELILRRIEGSELGSVFSYVGRVEPNDCLRKGKIDLLVGDGCSINWFIKTAEASFLAVRDIVRDEFDKLSCLDRVSIFPGVRALRKVRDGVYAKIDPDKYNGALMLGYNGVVVKGHGASSADAVYHGLVRLVDALNSGVRVSLNKDISENLEKCAQGINF